MTPAPSKKKYTTWGADGALLCASDELRECVEAVNSPECVILETGSTRGWRIRDWSERGKLQRFTLADVEAP